MELSNQSRFPRHYEGSLIIKASPDKVFAYIDDHTNLSSHMAEPNWMMGGGRMETTVDEGKGQKAGSHITMRGTAFGFTLFLDEVVTRYDPPFAKEWQTVGNLRLLIIGHYRLGVEIKPEGGGSLARVYIDYALPATGTWLGRLFGKMYAKWCVKQMLDTAANHFNR